MSDLFSKLGIDWKLLLAQGVNFALLLLILTKFFYKPVIKMLDERRKKIADNAENENIMAKKLQEMEAAKEKILTGARNQSEKIIKQAEKNAEEVKETIIKEASSQAEKIYEESKRELAGEKKKVFDELKRELGSLISASLEKGFGDVIDGKMQEKLVNEAVKNVPNSK